MLESNAAAPWAPATQRAEARFGADGDAPVDLGVVDAVLWAFEFSEDEGEVGDLVEAALQSSGVRPVAEPAAGSTP